MQFKIENITIECDQVKLFINKEKIECSDRLLKAFNLFLCSNNEVISKNQLINTLWEGTIVSDDSLFKIIQLIRNIFKEHNLNNEVLINVYGKGYKIAPKIHIIDKLLEQNNNHSVGIKKSHKFKQPFILKISVITLGLIGILFLSIGMKKNNSNLLSPNDYKTVKSQILSAPSKAQKSLNSFKKSNLSKIDQQTLNALKGQIMYHQGNYKESVESLELAINIDQNSNTLALADSYYVLARIYLYKSNHEKLLEYTNHASTIYHSLKDFDGIYKSKDLKIEYLIMIHQYQKATNMAHKLLDETRAEKHILGQLYALTSLYRTYSLLNKPEESVVYIKQALDLALKNGNEKFISYASGTLAIHSMSIGQFTESMKWANLTLKNALTQTSTNNFQQGFSYIYNILSPLGHNLLAEKYLQKAIDVQDHFNSDGHIHTAEINLGILKIKLKKHTQASTIFKQLLGYNLSQADRYETLAWTALNEYYFKDYIASYTTAKSVLNSPNVNNKTQLVSSIALILSSLELEREKEALQIFENIKELANPNWLIEYELYLNMAVQIANESNLESFTQQKTDFETRMQTITERTIPNPDHLKELDKYLDNILK